LLTDVEDSRTPSCETGNADHLSEVGGRSGSINRKTDGSGANYLYIASTAHPARGGSWHKWTGGV